MYQRFKHDNGDELENVDAIKVSALEFIRFRSREELRRFDPSRIEYWQGVSSEKNAEISFSQIPPDPLSDDIFQR